MWNLIRIIGIYVLFSQNETWSDKTILTRSNERDFLSWIYNPQFFESVDELDCPSCIDKLDNPSLKENMKYHQTYDTMKNIIWTS